LAGQARFPERLLRRPQIVKGLSNISTISISCFWIFTLSSDS
jgi:hypothetical protein